MLTVWLTLIPALIAPAAPSVQDAFLRAWADSRYEEACTHLDALKAPLVGAEVVLAAGRARARCAAAALGRGAFDAAEHELDALDNLPSAENHALPLRQSLAGWRALKSARSGALERAVKTVADVPGSAWPVGLDTEILRGASAAVRKHELVQAKAALRLLESRAPQTFGLEELRQALWWATEGGRIAFRIALGGFLLLLALTARSLLRTRRRARALLQAESQT